MLLSHRLFFLCIVVFSLHEVSGAAVDSLAVPNLGLVSPFVYITGSISFNRDWDHNGKYTIFLPNSEGHKRPLKGATKGACMRRHYKS